MDPLTKFEPVAASVNADPPAIAVLGEILVSDGGGLVTVKASPVEVPPPGVGVKTVIENVPAEATSDAGIVAVSCVLLTKVVVRLAPLTCTTEAETKLLPVTVNINPGLPAVALVGEILANDGGGLLTASDSVPEAEPPGLITPMARLPVEAMSLAGMAAVSCVEVTNVVVRFAPFTWTMDPLTKFEPVAVNVNAGPPTVAEVGEMLVSDGAVLLTVKFNDPDVPPPGVGLNTVTGRL